VDAGSSQKRNSPHPDGNDTYGSVSSLGVKFFLADSTLLIGVGCEHIGTIQRLIRTCKLHDVAPSIYLTHEMLRVSQYPAKGAVALRAGGVVLRERSDVSSLLFKWLSGLQ
jgi:hypothetical protein